MKRFLKERKVWKNLSKKLLLFFWYFYDTRILWTDCERKMKKLWRIIKEFIKQKTPITHECLLTTIAVVFSPIYYHLIFSISIRILFHRFSYLFPSPSLCWKIRKILKLNWTKRGIHSFSLFFPFLSFKNLNGTLKR